MAFIFVLELQEKVGRRVASVHQGGSFEPHKIQTHRGPRVHQAPVERQVHQQDPAEDQRGRGGQGGEGETEAQSAGRSAQGARSTRSKVIFLLIICIN